MAGQLGTLFGQPGGEAADASDGSALDMDLSGMLGLDGSDVVRGLSLVILVLAMLTYPWVHFICAFTGYYQSVREKLTGPAGKGSGHG